MVFVVAFFLAGSAVCEGMGFVSFKELRVPFVEFQVRRSVEGWFQPGGRIRVEEALGVVEGDVLIGGYLLSE